MPDTHPDMTSETNIAEEHSAPENAKSLHMTTGRLLFTCLGLVALVFVAHHTALQAGFVNYDDPGYVTDRAIVQEGLTLHGMGWAMTSLRMANWHPITWMSHMLDVSLWGMQPTGHHLTSLLIHAANAVLLFLFLFRATGAPWRSIAVAAVFAVHPMHVESVTWISERKDVLSIFFGLLAVHAYVGHARAPSIVRMLGVALFMALSLMAKPMLVTLPLGLLLLDVWPLNRTRLMEQENRWAGFSRLVLEKWPLFLLTMASCAVTLIAQSGGGAMRTVDEYSLWLRLANAVTAYAAYFGKMLLPHNMAVLYPFPDAIGFSTFAPALLFLAASTYGAIRFFRAAPYLIVGWLWFLGALVPVIGIVQVGYQSMADRYAYFPYVGLYVATAWGVWKLLSRVRIPWIETGWAMAIVIWTVIGGLIPVAWDQNKVWESSETLFRHTVSVTRNNFIAHNLLGAALSEQGRYEAAGDQFQKALAINPEYPMAYYNMGLELLKLGSYEEALPPFEEAVKFDDKDPKALDMLGITLFHLGRVDEAKQMVRRANDADPGFAKGRNDLGYMYMESGELEQAAKLFDDALRLDPAYADAAYNKGIILLRTGDEAEAARAFERVLELDEAHLEATYNLAAVLLAKGSKDRGVKLLRRALEIDPDFGPAKARLRELGIVIVN